MFYFSCWCHVCCKYYCETCHNHVVDVTLHVAIAIDVAVNNLLNSDVNHIANAICMLLFI